MNKAFINNFRASSKAQLDRMNAFVKNFFEPAMTTADFFVASPLVQDNYGSGGKRQLRRGVGSRKDTGFLSPNI